MFLDVNEELAGFSGALGEEIELLCLRASIKGADRRDTIAATNADS